jgi:hypothetical protein
MRALFDLIFKLAVAFGQFCDHYVKPKRRIEPLGWGISDALAENELVSHVGAGQTLRSNFTTDTSIGTIRRHAVNQIPFLQL